MVTVKRESAFAILVGLVNSVLSKISVVQKDVIITVLVMKTAILVPATSVIPVTPAKIMTVAVMLIVTITVLVKTENASVKTVGKANSVINSTYVVMTIVGITEPVTLMMEAVFVTDATQAHYAMF